MDKRIPIIGVIVLAIVIVVATAVFLSSTDERIHITYNGNGGTTVSGDTVVCIDSDIVTPPAFTYPGNMLVSWNTEPDGSGTRYSVDSKVSGNVTLYAQWVPKSLKISLYPFENITMTLYGTGMEPQKLGMGTFSIPNNAYILVSTDVPDTTVSIDNGMLYVNDGDGLGPNHYQIITTGGTVSSPVMSGSDVRFDLSLNEPSVLMQIYMQY